MAKPQQLWPFQSRFARDWCVASFWWQGLCLDGSEACLLCEAALFRDCSNSVKGTKSLVASGTVSKDPAAIAAFLREHKESMDTTQIGEYFGHHEELAARSSCSLFLAHKLHSSKCIKTDVLQTQGLDSTAISRQVSGSGKEVSERSPLRGFADMAEIGDLSVELPARVTESRALLYPTSRQVAT